MLLFDLTTCFAWKIQHIHVIWGHPRHWPSRWNCPDTRLKSTANALPRESIIKNNQNWSLEQIDRASYIPLTFRLRSAYVPGPRASQEILARKSPLEL